MSEYTACVKWQRGEQGFTDNSYSRGHEWIFDGGLTVPASSSPHVVPLPMSVEYSVDPEEAYVAALSSCHMLFFLSISAARGFTVDQYVDNARGIMEKDSSSRVSVTRVELCPEAEFSGEEPTGDVIHEMHELAHKKCFLANSVKSEISINLDKE